MAVQAHYNKGRDTHTWRYDME